MINIKGKSIVLKNFSLMKDGSPIYYAENFGVADYGFGKVLVPMNVGYKKIDEDTATLTQYAGNGFSGVSGIDVLDEGGTKFLYWIDSNSNIWCMKETLITGQKLYDTDQSCSYADLKITGTDKNSDIIYSTKDKVGRIYRGEATGGSATTLIDTGVDFTTMSIAAGDRVYNIKDNKLFTINAGGITATTLTITAVDGGDFASGDEYCIVDPNWQSLTDDKTDYGRQIIEFDEDFYILNGDALAIVDSSMAYTAEHKAIESGWIARTGASNGDSIAIGCNKNNLGKLFIWDKHSNGWNKKIALDNEIKSIVAYKNGYVYIEGNSVWWTDTYTTRRLSEFPGVAEGDTIEVNPRGMIILQNKVLINGGTTRINKAKMGVWIYDIPRDEWNYSPYEPKSGEEKASYNATRGIFFFSSWLNFIYFSFTNSGCGWTNSKILSTLSLGSGSSRGTVITNPIRLGKDARIKKIEVNLVPNLKDYNNAASKSKTMTCKLSNCDSPLWRYQQAYADSTVKNKINVYGATVSYANAQVGDEICILDGWNGHLRRRIIAITGDGTNAEEWTLDSDLTNLTKQYTTMSVMPFQIYGMDEKTITDETKMLEFYPNFYGDSVMIELGITGSDYPLIAIESVKIYWE